MVLFYKIWKNYNEIQLTKNKKDLNNRKLKIIKPPPAHKSQTLAKRRPC